MSCQKKAIMDPNPKKKTRTCSAPKQFLVFFSFGVRSFNGRKIHMGDLFGHALKLLNAVYFFNLKLDLYADSSLNLFVNSNLNLHLSAFMFVHF